MLTEVVLANYKGMKFYIYEDEKISTSLTNHFEIYFPDEKYKTCLWNWH
jgi:hypothetical protein